MSTSTAETEAESDTKEDAPESTDKGEHNEYSEKVNKRISKLVGKLREAERREEAAIKYASGLKTKQEELEANFNKVNESYVSTMETASTSQVEEAKLRLKRAIEDGDIDAQADAQSILARATLDSSTTICSTERNTSAYLRQSSCSCSCSSTRCESTRMGGEE